MAKIFKFPTPDDRQWQKYEQMFDELLASQPDQLRDDVKKAMRGHYFRLFGKQGDGPTYTYELKLPDSLTPEEVVAVNESFQREGNSLYKQFAGVQLGEFLKLEMWYARLRVERGDRS